METKKPFKKQTKNLLMLLVISLSLGGVSCSVKIPNVKSYLQLASGAAFFKHLNTGTEGRLTKDEWDVVKIGTICHTPTDFGEILKNIEKQCVLHSNCSKDMVDRANAILVWYHDKKPSASY